MKYIIDIPEDIRVAISQMGLLRIPDEMMKKVDEAIQHGTPLPKGHGDLIDVQDAVDNLMEYKENGGFGNYDKLTIRGCIDRIENHVNPIIEADKAEIEE